MDLLAGLITAVANSFTSILSKGLTSRLPAAQLVFPLLTLNVLMVLPAAPFVEWVWTPWIAFLMLVSATLLVVGSFAMFELYDHGSPASAVTAQSISPIPATLAVSLLLPGTLDPAQVVAAVVVLCAVLVGLNESFGDLGRWRTMATIVVAAVGTGLLTVSGRVLIDEGAGLIQVHLVRCAIGACMCLVIAPPRDIRLRDVPQMVPRAALVTFTFLLILYGSQQGNPAVVQTGIALSPIVSLGIDTFRTHQRPSRRLTASATLATFGVALMLLF